MVQQTTDQVEAQVLSWVDTGEEEVSSLTGNNAQREVIRATVTNSCLDSHKLT